MNEAFLVDEAGNSVRLVPCEACELTGFSDKVHRGVWTMEPKELICKVCNGRGWTTNGS